MSISKRNIFTLLSWGVIGLIAYWLFSPFYLFPIPRGSRVDPEYHTYYKNIKGIYYISVRNASALITHGSWGYLHDCDQETFQILSSQWSKDKNHVWHEDEIFEGADSETFTVDKVGLPKDKNNVYVLDQNLGIYRPSKSGIDIASAEGFVDRRWMRDSQSVYLDDVRLDVDRNTFARLGKTEWWVDKDYIYDDVWDRDQYRIILLKVDTLQSLIDTKGPEFYYMRNGRNIIYLTNVIAKDIDVERFEKVNVFRCIVNDMLFDHGKRILENRLNVSEAKFYHSGWIAVDREHVFYKETLLDDIDASTFREVDDRTFEDKNYTYVFKDVLRNQSYPFHKKKK